MIAKFSVPTISPERIEAYVLDQVHYVRERHIVRLVYLISALIDE